MKQAILLSCAFLLTACAPTRNLTMFAPSNTRCYDRNTQPSTFAVDSHHHFRSFGHKSLDYNKLLQYFTKQGVVFVNAYGIGQTLPKSSTCEYVATCPGTPVKPSIDNDIINAQNSLKFGAQGIHLTLSMSFPDLADPAKITAKINQLDQSYPNLFKWMGEVNLVKQALFKNAHKATPIEKIAQWHDFMTILLKRDMPISIHSDLGNDESPTKYLFLMEEVLKQYPDNKIVWVHMGLSRELANMDPVQHIAIMKSKLDAHPNLMLDIAWRILDEYYFTEPQSRQRYVDFFNQYSTQILPGSDFVASANQTYKSFKASVAANSNINRYLDDNAFRNIVLGQNYIHLLGLNYRAPTICLSKLITTE
jgi:predicted TIM-barrel fold metal-dependent hydrolase